MSDLAVLLLLLLNWSHRLHWSRNLHMLNRLLNDNLLDLRFFNLFNFFLNNLNLSFLFNRSRLFVLDFLNCLHYDLFRSDRSSLIRNVSWSSKKCFLFISSSQLGVFLRFDNRLNLGLVNWFSSMLLDRFWCLLLGRLSIRNQSHFFIQSKLFLFSNWRGLVLFRLFLRRSSHFLPHGHGRFSWFLLDDWLSFDAHRPLLSWCLANGRLFARLRDASLL